MRVLYSLIQTVRSKIFYFEASLQWMMVWEIPAQIWFWCPHNRTVDFFYFFFEPGPLRYSCSIWTHAPTHSHSHTRTQHTPLERTLDHTPELLWLRKRRERHCTIVAPHVCPGPDRLFMGINPRWEHPSCDPRDRTRAGSARTWVACQPS